MTIFHIATATEAQAAQQRGEWTISTRGASISQQGFMHACSTADQIQRVGHFIYPNLPDAWVLALDEDELAAAGFEIRQEPGDPTDPASELFPHIYGGVLPATLLRPVLGPDKKPISWPEFRSAN